MKKFLPILLVVFALFMLSACNADDDLDDDLIDTNTSEMTDEEEDEDLTGVYKDGTYTARSEDYEEGYETVDVTVTDGRISDVVLRKFGVDQNEADYTTGGYEDIRTSLREEVLQNQSADEFTVTDSSPTTQNWITALREALDDAREGITGGNEGEPLD